MRLRVDEHLSQNSVGSLDEAVGGDTSSTRGDAMETADTSRPLDRFLYEQVKGRSGRKLDYGYGNGRFLRFCEQRGLEVLGTDAFEYHYKNWDQGNERVTRIVNDVAPYPDGYFSCIVSNMVFEHISSDKVDKVASEISRLLAPDGVEIIFPNNKHGCRTCGRSFRPLD